jgi:hypothetical protein
MDFKAPPTPMVRPRRITLGWPGPVRLRAIAPLSLGLPPIGLGPLYRKRLQQTDCVGATSVQWCRLELMFLHIAKSGPLL